MSKMIANHLLVDCNIPIESQYHTQLKLPGLMQFTFNDGAKPEVNTLLTVGD